MFASTEYRSCPTCGEGTETRVPVSSIVVHVLGAVQLAPEEKAELIKEIAERVTVGWGRAAWTDRESSELYYPEEPGSSGPCEYDHGRTGSSTCPSAPAGEESETGFAVCRRGRWVASVPAAVLEEAAAKVSALAAALGWEAKAGVEGHADAAGE